MYYTSGQAHLVKVMPRADEERGGSVEGGEGLLLGRMLARLLLLRLLFPLRTGAREVRLHPAPYLRPEHPSFLSRVYIYVCLFFVSLSLSLSLFTALLSKSARQRRSLYVYSDLVGNAFIRAFVPICVCLHISPLLISFFYRRYFFFFLREGV